MKNLRRFSAIGVLILALALPAFAGEMNCPVAATSDAAGVDAVTVDSLTGVALTVLSNALVF